MHSCLSKLKDLATSARLESTGMTMCFTTIHGGNKNNVVADHCTTEVDVRFPLPQVEDDIRDIIVNRLRGEDFQLDVEYTIEAYESIRTHRWDWRWPGYRLGRRPSSYHMPPRHRNTQP